MDRIRFRGFAAKLAAIVAMVAAALGGEAVWALNGPIVLDFLAGTDGFRIVSQSNWENFAEAVALLPDLNGDGIGEIAVAAPASLTNARVYVLFGAPGASAPVVDADQVNGSNGFRVSGLGDGHLGTEVHSAGDFNGDGRNDLLLMTRGIDRAYIILGRMPWPAIIDLSRATIGVVELVKPSGKVGINVSFGISEGASTASGPGGDFNGDGYDDIALIATDASGGVGTCAIAFGRSVIAGQVNLDALNGANGFTFARRASAPGTINGCRLVGDVDGDGFADLAASNYEDPGPAGSVFVFRGDVATPALVQSNAASPPRGFRIGGPGTPFDPIRFGHVLKSAGDLNNDGLGDLALGTRYLNTVHIVFGRRVQTPVVLVDTLDGNSGYKVTSGPFGPLGSHLAGAGDVDGDGIDDLLLGAARPDPAPGVRAWIQFGRNGSFGSSASTSSLIDDLGLQNTFLQTGSSIFDEFIVAMGADVNGDGIDDYVVGEAKSAGIYGRAFVVFGKAGRLVCRTTSAGIPDNNATGITSSMPLAANAPLALVEPFVNIAHTWVGDLAAWITSPAGSTVQLVDRPGHNPPPPFPPSIGLCAADNMVLSLADNAATSVDLDCSRSDVAGTPAYTGSRYRPTQAVSAFNGQSIAGNWQLRVADNVVQDVGTLTRWCMSYFPQRVAPPASDLVLRNGFE